MSTLIHCACVYLYLSAHYFLCARLSLSVSLSSKELEPTLSDTKASSKTTIGGNIHM